MPLTAGSVRTDVRNMVLGLTVKDMSDAAIDTSIKLALNRLSKDASITSRYTLVGTGATFYSLSSLISDWSVNRSVVKGVISPKPDTADSDEITTLEEGVGYETYFDGTSDFIRFADALATGDEALIEYVTPWKLAGLVVESDELTTLPARYENALLFLTSANVCYARAGQMSGLSSATMPADIINYRSKEAEYRRTGREWERLYEQELGIGAGGKSSSAAAIARRAYPRRDQSGDTRLTHRTYS